jgi:signal transduction histidine kinase
MSMAPEGHLLPYRLRTVRIGLIATLLVVPPLAALPFLNGAGFDRTPYLATIACALLGAAILHRLPWSRLFEAGHGMTALGIWSVLDILMISALVAFSGGSRSELVWVYTLTTFFLAASYTPRTQVVLLAFTLACYVSATLIGGGAFSPSHLLIAISVLGTLAFMVSFLSRQLVQQMGAHAEAREESERRATLLRTVAGAAAPMSTLDSEAVFAAVIDAAVSLGYEGATFNVLDPGGATYHVSHAIGVPTPYASKTYPADSGIQAIVRREQRTIVIEDYTAHPLAMPALTGAGFTCGLLTPVWADGEIAAVLCAGRHERVAIPDEDVEAFELLAAHAGRALENAHRFEAERRTVARLAELDRMKQDFLSNVSHELRTPLTVIEGIASTLDTRWERLDEDRRREFVSRIYSNSMALDAVISTLLDFNQLENGRIEVRPQLVDLGSVAERAVARLGSLFETGSLSCDTDGDAVVRADPMLVDRVVENLLSNAAKHTPKGTTVHVRVTSDDGAAVVRVSDRGPGIPPDEVAHLGERFFRGGESNTRRTRGTGLGLAFVREVLALHGATLEIHSMPGEGSCFSFAMPLATEPLAAMEAARMPRSA